MPTGINRRGFLRMGATAGAAAMIAPRWMMAQAASNMVEDMRQAAAKTPIKTTKLYDNLFLLQGVGGNMAVQTGKDGTVLIDSSFSTAGPAILAAMKSAGAGSPDMLINTHWHFDHTDGNEGMHQAGFAILAHQKTRERLAEPHTVKLLGLSLPAAPTAALPALTFDTTFHAWHNGDSLNLEYFAPAHTDTDISIHFQQADVLHVGDTWFNGFYPFIDESTGGNIGGMIAASEKTLKMVGSDTKIIPGHGPLGTKAQLQTFHDMLAGVRDKVAALKSAGASEQEAIAKKPTAAWDDAWSKGSRGPDMFVGIVYRTI
jgi:glyoxylase-like metal-dependent hydrolase (beta-lactamase superfamily II)